MRIKGRGLLALGSLVLVLSGCASGVSSAGPPDVSGLQPNLWQAYMSGWKCADIEAHAAAAPGIYWDVLATMSRTSFNTGSQSQWLAAIDWWWKNTCEGERPFQ